MTVLALQDTDRLVRLLRDEASDLGFDALAITRPSGLPRGDYLDRWLGKGYAGTMEYLRRWRAARRNPQSAWPEVKTIVSVALNYHTGVSPAGEKGRTRQPGTPPSRSGLLGAISRYAWGRDYHKVIKKRLVELARRVEASGLGRAVKCYVDTGPVLEREWGAKAGLGWIGKNTLLLNPDLGSWFFLGVLLLDAELPPDGGSQPDLCGSCNRCVEACPTGALIRPYVMDARRCISYLNIEHRGWIPRELRPLMGNWIFGCDDCQSVCPYNEDTPVTAVKDFQPRQGLDAPDLIRLLGMDEESFRTHFAGTPVMRARWAGMMRNVAVALGNSGEERAVEPLGGALAHPEPVVRGHAAWALGQIGGSRAAVLLRGRLPSETDPTAREEIREALQAIRQNGGGC